MAFVPSFEQIQQLFQGPVGANPALIANPDLLAAEATRQNIPPPGETPMGMRGQMRGGVGGGVGTPPGSQGARTFNDIVNPNAAAAAQPNPNIVSGGEEAFAGAPGAAQPSMADRLMRAFRGVQAPPRPEMQRISSPAAPRPSQNIANIGDPSALMRMLLSGVPQGGQAPQASSLAQLIGGR